MLGGIGIFAVFGFFLCALTPFSNFVSRQIAVHGSEQSAEAIVVLGAGVMRGGILNDESMRRAVYGIQLYKKGLAPLIVFSGPRQEPFAASEARIRARLAESVGVPSDAIWEEANANTTREEALRISKSLEKRRVRKVLLVTESIHMKRARLVFLRVGLDVSPAPSDNFPDVLEGSRDRLWLAVRSAQESAALIYYRIAGFI